MRFRVAVLGCGGGSGGGCRSRRAGGTRAAAPERGSERDAAPAPSPAPAASVSAAGRVRRTARPGRGRGGSRGRPGGAAGGRARSGTGAARPQARAAAHGGSPPLSRSVAGGRGVRCGRSGRGCQRGDAARRYRYVPLRRGDPPTHTAVFAKDGVFGDGFEQPRGLSVELSRNVVLPGCREVRAGQTVAVRRRWKHRLPGGRALLSPFGPEGRG